jgi:hypothetical protein
MTQYRPLLEALVSHEVEFIVIGGVAATIHGSARFTQDLDVVYRRSPDNLARIAAALAPHAPYLRGAPRGLPFVLDADTLLRGLNFTLTTDLGSIDLLAEVAGGGTYDTLLPRSALATVYDATLRVVSLEGLIHLKRAAGRPRDLEAIAELESLRQEAESSEE